MKKLWIFISLCLLILLGIVLYSQLTKNSQNFSQSSTVYIGNAKVIVEVESTPESRAKGLSGRNSLENNYGMLFIFPNNDRHGFWMKEMKFPIDIIWIDTDRVVSIKENAPVPNPSETLPIYVPQEAANLVLEVPAGYTREHDIRVGSKVEVKNKN